MKSKETSPCLLLFSIILLQRVHVAFLGIPGPSLRGSKSRQGSISMDERLSKAKALSSEGLLSKKQLLSQQQPGSGKQVHFREEPFSRERSLSRDLTLSPFQTLHFNSRELRDDIVQPMSIGNVPSSSYKKAIGKAPSTLKYSLLEQLHHKGKVISGDDVNPVDEQFSLLEQLQPNNYVKSVRHTKQLQSRSRRAIRLEEASNSEEAEPPDPSPIQQGIGEHVLILDEMHGSKRPVQSGEPLREALLTVILERSERMHGDIRSEDGQLSLGNNQSGDIWSTGEQGGHGEDGNYHIQSNEGNHSQNSDYYSGVNDSYMDGYSGDKFNEDIQSNNMRDDDEYEMVSNEYNYEDFVNDNFTEVNQSEPDIGDVYSNNYDIKPSHDDGSNPNGYGDTELLTRAALYSEHGDNTGNDGNGDDAAWQTGRWPGDPPSAVELLISAHSLGLPASVEALLCLEGECDGEPGTSARTFLPDPAHDNTDAAFIPPHDSTDVLTSNYGQIKAGLPPPHDANTFQSGEQRQNQPLAEAEVTTTTDSAPIDVTLETAAFLTKDDDKRRGARPKSNYGNAGVLKGNGRGWEGSGVSGLGTKYHQKPSLAAGRPHRPIPASHSVTSGKTPVRPNELPSNHVSSGYKGRQRFIFGSDDRGRVSIADSRKYPYNNVVRMSNGCTGTLVSPKHILTAAHCLHTGYKFKAAPYRLKVHIPHSMGTRVYYARAIKVSRKWHKVYQLSNLHRAMFDYGVLELRHPLRDRRRFTGFNWFSDTWRRPISFVAYPADTAWGQPYLLRSTCHVDLEAGSLLLNQCDSARGTSGSAAIMSVKKRGLRIVGIVSAVVSDVLPVSRDFNVITRLTLPKLWDICDMLGRGWDRYVCSDYLLRKRPTRPGHRYLYQNG